MAEEQAVETIMNRIAPIAVSWLLLAAMCFATQAPRLTYDPAQQGAAQKSRQSFVDFTLRRINPSDKDYGRCLEEARIVIIGETIKSAYFWSNVVSLSLLGCLFIVVVYQHHQRIGRESAMAEVLQQYGHALSRASAQVDEATKRNHELMEALTAARENTFRLPVTALVQREGPASREVSKQSTNAVAVEETSARPAAASAEAKSTKSVGNRTDTGNQMGLFKPDVDLILKVNSLEQQLERSQEQEKQLRRQLGHADQRLQAEQQKNRSLKGA